MTIYRLEMGVVFFLDPDGVFVFVAQCVAQREAEHVLGLGVTDGQFERADARNAVQQERVGAIGAFDGDKQRVNLQRIGIAIRLMQDV